MTHVEFLESYNKIANSHHGEFLSGEEIALIVSNKVNKILAVYDIDERDDKLFQELREQYSELPLDTKGTRFILYM